MSDFDLVVKGDVVDAHAAAPSARDTVDARGMWGLPGVIDGEQSMTPARLLDSARVLYHTISTLDTTPAAARR